MCSGLDPQSLKVFREPVADGPCFTNTDNKAKINQTIQVVPDRAFGARRNERTGLARVQTPLPHQGAQQNQLRLRKLLCNVHTQAGWLVADDADKEIRRGNINRRQRQSLACHGIEDRAEPQAKCFAEAYLPQQAHQGTVPRMRGLHQTFKGRGYGWASGRGNLKPVGKERDTDGCSRE